MCLTNRSHFATCLFNNIIGHRWRQTERGTEKLHTSCRRVCLILMFFHWHFDFFYNLLINRRAAKWNLFVLYNEQKRRQTYHVTLDCWEFFQFRKFSCCYKNIFVSMSFFGGKKMEFARHLTDVIRPCFFTQVMANDQSQCARVLGRLSNEEGDVNEERQNSNKFR